MTKKDYYQTLGINKNASKEEIKKAYKQLAKECHPDLHKGDKVKEEKFKEASEAARVLLDDKMRSHYDRHGTADLSGMGAAGPEGYDFQDFDFDFTDIFSGFFGGDDDSGGRGRGRRQRRRSGRDLKYSIEITLEEADSGFSKDIIIEKMGVCSKCKGTKAKHESDIKTCSECKGTGYMKQTQRTPFGLFSATFPCKRCHGNGTFIKELCPVCDGEGRVKVTQKVNIRIPEGVDTGMVLRVSNEGEVGEDGTAGDLFVEITVLSHEVFTRKGDDLHVDIPISFVQAALGSEIDVPTLNGKAALKIPEATQTGTIFRMKGKGVQRLQQSGAGDEMVRVIIQTPDKLTKKQREILEEFAAEGGDKLKSDRKGFFDKLKGWK